MFSAYYYDKHFTFIAQILMKKYTGKEMDSKRLSFPNAWKQMKTTILYSVLLQLLSAVYVSEFKDIFRNKAENIPAITVLCWKNKRVNGSVGSAVKKSSVITTWGFFFFFSPLKGKDCCDSRWLITNYVLQVVSEFCLFHQNSCFGAGLGHQ